MVVNSVLCVLTNLPQFHKESTSCKLCHIDAVTVKSHLLVLVIEDIMRGILVGSDLKLSRQTPLSRIPFITSSDTKDIYASIEENERMSDHWAKWYIKDQLQLTRLI